VRVHAEGERRIGVAQHVGDPPDAPARLQRERGPRVAGAVQLERPDADLVRATPQAEPGALGVAGVGPATHFRAEHPGRDVGPAFGQGLAAPRGQEIEQLLREPRRQRNAPRLPTLRCPGPRRTSGGRGPRPGAVPSRRAGRGVARNGARAPERAGATAREECLVPAGQADVGFGSVRWSFHEGAACEGAARWYASRAV